MCIFTSHSREEEPVSMKSPARKVGAECLPVSGPHVTLAGNRPEYFCAVRVTFLFLFESTRLYGNE